MIVVFTCFVISLTSLFPLSKNRIEIVTPTVEQEATSIWRTINDITFLEQQGYSIKLPNHPTIDSLVLKSRNDTFDNDDFQTIYSFLENNLFNQENYELAIQKVINQTELINNILDEINTTKEEWEWTFNTFDVYKIIFTLYGTGGSYNPDDGSITLLTDQDGNFMNYVNPANTIIHEITHIGMEYSIVQKYNLSHGLKERVIDTFVFMMFSEELPEYRIQNMGNNKIDHLLEKPEDIKYLDRIISNF